jgi:hypothetical protein
MIDPLERRYVHEMLVHASDRICLELTLVELGFVVAAVQLAQRHPEMPLTLRADLDRIIATTIEALRDAYPAVAEGMERGNDPDCDYPREPERSRR